CTPPAKGSPMFELGENEIEFGIGIHGEPGRKRLPLVSADEITAMLAQSIFEDTGYTRILREWNEDQQDWEEVELTDPNLEKGDRVLAFVNSMGGTPLSELYIIYRKLAQICSEQNIQIVRNLVGPYITSLEMQGCSITLLKLDDELLKLWDAPVQTPALRWGV
ncbi:MAG: dihydroxyacetone kinase, partial [Cyanobacteria bacterium]|nr:dihydroxyacetone kinase [Cyanobacteria bacterium GSL.Bin1]